MVTREFSSILAEHGLEWTVDGVWLRIESASGEQGWKLHLSSVPLDADELLRRALPILRERRAAFKVLRSSELLAAQVCGEVGETQVGKFITVYPRSNDEALALARALVPATDGLRGPVVPTDIQLGDVVFARYGSFHPHVHIDRLGQRLMQILGPDGERIEDKYAIPFRPPQGIENPFEGFARSPVALGPTGLLGPGYRVVDVLLASAKGAVLLAMDLREQKSVDLVVLKQGRQHTFSDRLGRDARMRLRRQAELLRELRDHPFVPQVGEYFEWGGDGFLSLEYVPGKTLEAFAMEALGRSPWSTLSPESHAEHLKVGRRLIAAVSELHQREIIHRDVAATNVWLADDGRVVLLDFELAHRIDDADLPLALGTPGFMSPNQAELGRPEPEDDIFGVGGCLILLFTGTDPVRLQFGHEDQQADRLAAWMGVSKTAELEIIARACRGATSERPALWELDNALARMLERPSTAPESVVVDTQLVERAARGLTQSVAFAAEPELWISYTFNHQVRHQGNRRHQYELMLDANRGVAGAIYTAAALHRAGHADSDLRRICSDAAKWLREADPRRQDKLPGLHFGRAGVGLALAEAWDAGLIDRSVDVAAWVRDALTSQGFDWPDVTHGAAGQGIAALRCAALFKAPELERLAWHCADYLVETQDADGTWPLPRGVETLVGERFTGFAHGAAGVLYFLSEAHRRTPRGAYAQALHKGLGALLDASTLDAATGTRSWPMSDRKPEVWRWWCHGAPGIALLFLRLYEGSGDLEWKRTARECLRTHAPDSRNPNLTICHGLAGLGEIYVEAARVLKDEEWVDRAQRIARLLAVVGGRNDDGQATSWMTEETGMPTGDLMVGSGGVVHFLLRLTHPKLRLPFPLLLPPLP